MASVPGQFLNQENIIKKVFDEATDSLRVQSTPAPGAATEAEQQAQTAILQSIDDKLNDETVDVYFTTPVIDTSITNISNVTYLQLVASTSNITKKIQIIEDIGEFMALYTGAASSEVLLCALPLGGGEVEVDVPAGTRISIRSLGPVVSSGQIVFNLLK